ncbi:MAG: glutathione-dependent formaldehyde dehydrogenase [Gammaproteobacteria bacterium]|nr:glutathione-dependent formaldehyde dehydrogenase [Gammaproteobacteria bacterium]
MKAVCWFDTEDVRVEQVPDPAILNPHDAIVKVTRAAICGSDLHLYDGYVPTMQAGDILGHEAMGEVVEVGSAVRNLRIGDRVVIPFTISCGQCDYCTRGLYSLCDNSNPNAWIPERLYGHAPAGFYGYSHAFGGYAGGQAEYVRVPFADSGPLRVPAELRDDVVLFLSDIFPTGYQAAEQCHLREGDVIAVWGCGPVGQFAIQSALLLGAERVIAIDRIPERLAMAEKYGKGRVQALNRDFTDVSEAVHDLTGGRGPDACIDAVGMESHGAGVMGRYDRVKQALMLETDRGAALREAILLCGKGGTVSVPGVYGGLVDTFPIGAAFNKGLTLKLGQTHVQKYMPMLLEHIVRGDIDPSFVITHRLRLDDAPEGYALFRDKHDGCIKVTLEP